MYLPSSLSAPFYRRLLMLWTCWLKVLSIYWLPCDPEATAANDLVHMWFLMKTEEQKADESPLLYRTFNDLFIKI